MKLISLPLRFDTGMMAFWKIVQQEDLPKPNSQKFTGHSSHMVIQPHSQRKLFRAISFAKQRVLLAWIW